MLRLESRGITVFSYRLLDLALTSIGRRERERIGWAAAARSRCDFPQGSILDPGPEMTSQPAYDKSDKAFENINQADGRTTGRPDGWAVGQSGRRSGECRGPVTTFKRRRDCSKNEHS